MKEKTKSAGYRNYVANVPILLLFIKSCVQWFDDTTARLARLTPSVDARYSQKSSCKCRCCLQTGFEPGNPLSDTHTDLFQHSWLLYEPALVRAQRQEQVQGQVRAKTTLGH